MKSRIVICTLALLFACSAGQAWGTAYTTNGTGGGNINAGATFAGGTGPTTNNGDTVAVANGDTLTFNVDFILGANDSAVGHAVTINGASAVSYGKVVVSDAVTVTLKGNDATSNTAMLINRYGLFEPAAGATILVDCASDFQTIISNKGIINAIGTAEKPVTFSSPAANVSWNNDVTAEATGAYRYDPDSSVGCMALAQSWISNAAGNGPGSSADSSVSFGSKSHETLLTSEVASLALVNSEGEYYVDYDMGYVYFYYSTATTPTFTKTYKYLTVAKGWGISAVENTTYNEAKFDHCVFRYMGKQAAADSRVINLRYKQSAAVAADRLFYLKNSAITNCSKFLGLKDCSGTAVDPLLITGNTINTVLGDTTYGYGITAYRSTNTYVTIDDNVWKSRGAGVYLTSYGAFHVDTGWRITNNTVTVAAAWLLYAENTHTTPGTLIDGNTITGVGYATDTRVINGVGGADGNPVTISNNRIDKATRAINMASYMMIEKNIISRTYHHGIIGTTADDIRVVNVRIRNNMFCHNSIEFDGSPWIELGYNHRMHMDDIQVVNNTFVGNQDGWIGFGDQIDTASYSALTRIVVANNIASRSAAGTSGALRLATDSNDIVRMHLLQFDYNLDYNQGTRYVNLTRQGTFTGLSNCAGVALFDPSFATATGKQLDFTYTSATDQTLTWDGGTAIQLVLDNGTATGGGNTMEGAIAIKAGYLDDTTKTWSTTKDNAACPQCHWVKITGGPGVGQMRMITNNTATKLTIVPPWETVPTNESTYAIIKTEVTLDDGADTVHAGVYLPELPTSTVQDTGIAFADHSVTGSDPLLVDVTSETATDFEIQTGSPAINSGSATYAAAVDYWNTGRPLGGIDDMGLYEFPYVETGTYTLAAPTPASGHVDAASGDFTIALAANQYPTSIVITPASDVAGTFTPATVTLTDADRTKTVTFTPTAIGTATITTTNGGSMTNPAGVEYEVTAAGGGKGRIIGGGILEWKPGESWPVAMR